MTRTLAFRAPAKLVVTGEYAVVEGSPALVLAVDRHVVVTLTAARTGSSVRLTSDLPGHAATAFDLARPAGEDASPVERLVRMTLARFDDPRPASIHLASQALFARDRGTKLGLGSSAALTVALAHALATWHGVAPEALDAYALHAEWQGGRGSGIDVAAALHGGVQVFERSTPVTVRTTPTDLPPGVHVAILFTGTATSTRSYLGAVHAFAEADRAGYDAAIEGLARAAAESIEACRNKAAEAFLRSIDASCAAMGTLGRASGVDIVSGIHSKIARAARSTGSVYKPSGAGGGDAGLAFATSPASLDRLARAVEALGVRRIAAGIDTEGCREVAVTEGPPS